MLIATSLKLAMLRYSTTIFFIVIDEVDSYVFNYNKQLNILFNDHS